MSRAQRNWQFTVNHEDGSVLERLVLARDEAEAEALAQDWCEQNRLDLGQLTLTVDGPLDREES